MPDPCFPRSRNSITPLSWYLTFRRSMADSKNPLPSLQGNTQKRHSPPTNIFQLVIIILRCTLCLPGNTEPEERNAIQSQPSPDNNRHEKRLRTKVPPRLKQLLSGIIPPQLNKRGRRFRDNCGTCQ